MKMAGQEVDSGRLNRRRWLAMVGLAGMAGAGSLAGAQTERDWKGHEPIRYPDPDVIAVEKQFSKYRITSATIERLAGGLRWAEGPAWNGGGNYLVWSDIP